MKKEERMDMSGEGEGGREGRRKGRRERIHQS